ncbi:MAG: hypothetical protein PVG07_07010 [Acidobacteriota bacterium]|jgi:hypothetical protein
MFEPDSRYADLETARTQTPDGRRIAYKRRRFLPRGDAMAVLMEVAPEAGERLDAIAHRTLGDPGQWWRIADANDALNPRDLTTGDGRRLRVPVPAAEGMP